MLAKITTSGELIITAETDIESFALSCWSNLYQKGNGDVSLIIETRNGDEQTILGTIEKDIRNRGVTYKVIRT